ncbi:unnamed protein product, partial [Mesorhabditis belari]|uniref:Uncharacterized protein n=1 Tax=Mesorhabditis belari TaxID=2138241 RepID=A0AAF3FNV9_9BILA
MYNEMRHQSNACYFLEQDPSYKILSKGSSSTLSISARGLEILGQQRQLSSLGTGFCVKIGVVPNPPGVYGENSISGSEGPEGPSADSKQSRMTRGLSAVRVSSAKSHPNRLLSKDKTEQSTSESTDRE